MKKTILAGILMFGALALSACMTMTPISKSEPCLGRDSRGGPGGRLYTQVAAPSCVETLAPFDMGIWLESALTSHKLRGYQTMRLGCGAQTPSEASCDNQASTGHSQTLMLNFDFSRITEISSVQRAVLLLYVVENPELMSRAAVRARLNIGADLANTANGFQIADQGRSGGAWVSYDITKLAGRAVLERRNSVSFEVSLPCNRPEMPGALISLSQEPMVVVEYK